MTYNYHRFVAYHPFNPEKKVTVEAFGDRGAKQKACRLLKNLKVIPPVESWQEIKLEVI